MLDFDRKYYVLLREGRKFKDIDTNSDIGTGLQRKGDNCGHQNTRNTLGKGENTTVFKFLSGNIQCPEMFRRQWKKVMLLGKESEAKILYLAMLLLLSHFSHVRLCVTP